MMNCPPCRSSASLLRCVSLPPTKSNYIEFVHSCQLLFEECFRVVNHEVGTKPAHRGCVVSAADCDDEDALLTAQKAAAARNLDPRCAEDEAATSRGGQFGAPEHIARHERAHSHSSGVHE